MTTLRSNFYTLASLSLVIIIDALVMGIVFPIMGALFINPVYAIVPVATSVVLRDFLYSLAMGIFFFCSIIGAPFFGDLSDRFGRRKALLISLFITSLSCLVCVAAITLKWVWLLIFARGVAGLTAGNQALAQAAIIDISTPETKARNIGIITLAACIGFVIGPIIGGMFSDSKILQSANFGTPFFIAAFFALLNAVCLLLTFRETFVPQQARPVQLSRGLLLLFEGFRHPGIRKWMMIFLLMQLGWGAYFQWISLLLAQVNHYSPSQIGLFMACVGVVFAVSLSTIVPICVKIYPLTSLIIVGLLLVIVGILSNGLWINAMFVHWVSMIPVALGEAFTYTCIMTLLSNAVDAEMQGLAMGIAAAVGSFAWGAAAFGVGILGSMNVRLPFIIGALLMTGCFVLLRPEEKS